MKDFLKGKFGTVIILLFTVILAGVAIFTALRLYQLRQQPVAPNVPSSVPRAHEATSPPAGACTLSFTLLTTTPTATPTGSPTATPTGTASSTATPTATPTGTPGSTPTATPTGSPTATPTGTASSTATPTATAPTLPVSGIDWPTILGAGIGLFVIIGSLLLAL